MNAPLRPQQIEPMDRPATRGERITAAFGYLASIFTVLYIIGRAAWSLWFA